MDVEQIAFTIIAHAGEAKSLAFEALSKAKQGCFNKADDLIEQSQKEVNLAHKGQMDLLVAEANGEKTDISVLLIHSQDHLMTCMLAIDLIKEMIVHMLVSINMSYVYTRFHNFRNLLCNLCSTEQDLP